MSAQSRYIRDLKDVLRQIEEHDTNYAVRELLVIEALRLAGGAGMQCGYRIDLSQPEWPVAFILLPTGQVSWHMPQFPHAWDGHDNTEKYRRIDKFIIGTEE